MIYMKRGAHIKLVDESAEPRLTAAGYSKMELPQPKKKPGANPKGGTDDGGKNGK